MFHAILRKIEDVCYQLREPLSILIKYKTTVTPKINILIVSSFRLSFSHHQE